MCLAEAGAGQLEVSLIPYLEVTMITISCATANVWPSLCKLITPYITIP